MRSDLRQRLDSVEHKMGIGNQVIVVIQNLDESEQKAQEKLNRWRAGEAVEGVSASPSTGPELVIFVQGFSRKSDGSEVTQEEYEKWHDY